MSQSHPQYPHLQVYQSQAGESPRAGAFYVPKYGDTLSGIAYAAYGHGDQTYWRLINRSRWNQQNCTYRKEQNRCDSAVASGPPWFLGLCPPYPVVWVPPIPNNLTVYPGGWTTNVPTRIEPDDVAPGSFTPIGPIGPVQPDDDGPGPSFIVRPIDDGDDSPVSPVPDEKKGLPWALIIGGTILGLGVIGFVAVSAGDDEEK